MSYLASLNPEQRAAVDAPLGPVLVKAGAGSGKTRVLTTRVAHLIEQGIEAQRILAVTFTNKAAAELRSRLKELLSKRAKGITAGTFHAICVKILRHEIEGKLPGYTSNFTIYASDEQLQLVQQALDSFTGRPPQLIEAPQMLQHISRFKSQMQSPSVAKRTATDPVNQYAAAIYRAYQRLLQQANAVDFDDLIGMTYRLLFEHPDVLDDVQHRWHHILVDEYQDTDAAQYALLELLTRPVAGRRRSLFAVGDAQQSIYGFRNADYTIITRFSRDFPDATVFELPTNYRSRQEILDAAYGVMRHSQAVTPMILRSGRGWPVGEAARREGLPPAIVINAANDERLEAEQIAQHINELLQKGRRPRDIAVLYRSKHMSRNLESALRHAKIPYALKNQAGFYDRRVIRDALAYLRMIVNPNDGLSLNRIINVPARGIGPATLSHLSAKAAEQSLPLSEAMLHPATWNGLSERAQQAGKLWASMVRRWRSLAVDSGYPPDHLLSNILEESGYLRAIKNDWPEDERQDALDYLQELQNAAAEHTDVREFLQEVALLTNVDDETEQHAVQLMTIHASKGLEWPVVFVAGLEEGVLPHERSIGEVGGIEEERRLCYVAVTRAGEQLLLSQAAKRARQPRKPSRFLEDIMQYGRELAQLRRSS